MVVDHTRVGHAFRRLSVPLAVQMLGDQVLGIADTIAIGYLGTVALAGITAATTVFFTLLITINGLWNGFSIIAAQRIGARDVDGYARTVRAGSVIPGIAALALTALSIPFAPPLMHGMIGSLPTADAAAQYLILRCASLIPINVSATLIVGLGAAGNRKLGVLLLAMINAIHIPLLLVLALGWLTHHAFGIVGAGVSTLVSETIAAIFSVIYVARKPMYRIFAQLSIDWRLAMRTAWLGVPECIFGFAVVAPDIAIVSMLAPLGAAMIAGFRALSVLSDLTFIVPQPLQSATQTVVGQRLGARDPGGAGFFLRGALRTALLVCAATGALVALLSWPLAFAITMNAAVASIAALPLALHMVMLPIKGWAMVALAPIRAAGDTRFSMVVGVTCGLLVLPLAWFSIERLHAGLYSVPIAWIIAWSMRAALTALKLRSESWSDRDLLTV
jgi:putative MATE family efflux protein